MGRRGFLEEKEENCRSQGLLTGKYAGHGRGRRHYFTRKGKRPRPKSYLVPWPVRTVVDPTSGRSAKKIRARPLSVARPQPPYFRRGKEYACRNVVTYKTS